MDKLATIYNPFEQVGAEEEFTGGSGLGLTIVRKILTLFGTHLSVHSEVGKGSEFSFGVWLQEERVAEKVDFDSFKGRFAGQKVMVVDDVRINRVVLGNFLKEVGFTVDEAQNGQECVDMFTNSPENTYSAIFMDIQMPVMDGWESAQVIRNLPRQDAQMIPIITISANAFDADVQKSLASGMDSHYAKPIQKNMLSEILALHCTPTS
jgi:CheY-like chemotaxis protein